jgi:hypothetical protein
MHLEFINRTAITETVDRDYPLIYIVYLDRFLPGRSLGSID